MRNVGCHYYCTLTPIWWLPHTDNQCATCLMHDTEARGGRPSKKGTSTITVDDVKKPSDLLISSLASQKYKCSNGRCGATMPLQTLAFHSTQCTGNPLQMPSTPSQIPLRDVLHAPVDKTLSTVERRAMGHLMKRMMTSSSAYGTHSTIIVSTGEQVR